MKTNKQKIPAIFNDIDSEGKKYFDKNVYINKIITIVKAFGARNMMKNMRKFFQFWEKRRWVKQRECNCDTVCLGSFVDSLQL